jgi:FtsZ-binding cell division protein ZapB
MEGTLVSPLSANEPTELSELVRQCRRELVELRQQVGDLRRENAELRQQAGYWK